MGSHEGAHHDRRLIGGPAWRVRVDDGLGQGKQGFARTIDGQHLRDGVHIQPIAAFHPGGKRMAQSGLTGGGRIRRQAAGGGGDGGHHRLLNKGRRGVFGLAHAQTDGAQGRVGRDRGKQLAQPLERVGLEV